MTAFLPAFLLTPIGEQPLEMPKPDDGEEVTDLGDIAAEIDARAPPLELAAGNPGSLRLRRVAKALAFR